MGGTGEIVKALEKLMKEENIKIIKDAEVTEIISKDRKVEGVKVNNSKIINCDYIVCNSDPPNVYKSLIKSQNNYGFLFKQKFKEWIILWVYSFIILDQKQYKDVSSYNFFGNSYEKHLNKIFEKNII